MNYSVVIRTLGQSGEYYQKTLDSIKMQTIKPSAIIIYIAEGYTIPKETIGIEQYVYVKKGMVAQRALPYSEVKTEYMLFLDDDVYLPADAVEKLYNELCENNGDVISPCVFYNHKVPTKTKIKLSLTGRELCRWWKDETWAFKVMRTAGFSYNNNPTKAVYRSQTNAGPCFFCRKDDFLKIDYVAELWLDETPYALPDDQVMFYKMHLKGLKVLTTFDTGIVHMDAGTTLKSSQEKNLKLIYSEFRNKTIFWYKYIYSMQPNSIMRLWSRICFGYMLSVQYLKYFIKKQKGVVDECDAFTRGLSDAKKWIGEK